MHTAHFPTPLGTCLIEGDELGISKIHVLDDAVAPTPEIPEPLQEAVMQLQEYFAGNRKAFTFQLNPKGTDFQKKVWQALIEIPFGKTVSYHALSIQLGDAKAIRAVASANGKNPLWIVVPCHRVIGSNGKLTGYAGGLWRKKWLLEHETPPTQQRLF
jgi:methylated-DNA-[protein]-cysteine S-methyltransferase